jgi:hypothetical protein
MMTFQRIAFDRIAAAALSCSEVLLRRWLPDGRFEGSEWVAINPTRVDSRRGSFKINVETGYWADFATGDRGGDLISLASYLYKIRQSEAALKIAQALGIGAHD